MLYQLTEGERKMKINSLPISQGNIVKGMKMTMSTAPTMSSRVHRRIMRAPHKRPHPGKPGKFVHAGKYQPHPGKIVSQTGKIVSHPGKIASHPGKIASHPGKIVYQPGKLSQAKYARAGHYAPAHTLRQPDHCENSNDSGLGPDHDLRHSHRSSVADEWEGCGAKRRRLASGAPAPVKVECDDANDTFPYTPPAPGPAPAHAMPLPVMRPVCAVTGKSVEHQRRIHNSYKPFTPHGGGGKIASKLASAGKIGRGAISVGKLASKLGYAGRYDELSPPMLKEKSDSGATAGLCAPLSNRSSDGTVELQILCQPESQHRARYQTEGSRGAVKDNSGNGFPVVKLFGYDKPAILEVFIGTDAGRVAPHMFYQACRVSGKNSTPCNERKVEGTQVIEIAFDPNKNWQVTCDCVGILKERNVDVEHRIGEACGASPPASRGKKKSTRCRMVFRTEVLAPNGCKETLQVCSTPIICTQPPGVPEVCRKSLVSCGADGGLELYLLGKNFLKETRVVFSQRRDGRLLWEEQVVPDKDFLQQTHLVCCVPPYMRTDITETVTVQLYVRSGGKTSEPHTFFYTPPALDTGPQHCTVHSKGADDAKPILMWGGSGMMPPPALPARRPSLILPDSTPLGLKSEVLDDSSQHSIHDHSDTSCGAEGSDKISEDTKGVDLRLKSESLVDNSSPVSFMNYEVMKRSPPTPQNESNSPLATFTQQLQAIQNQVQTEKMVESVTAAIFNSEENAGQLYGQSMLPMDRLPLIPSKSPMIEEEDIKNLNDNVIMADAPMPVSAMQAPADQRLLVYSPFDKMPSDQPTSIQTNEYNAYRTVSQKNLDRIEQRLAEQSACLEALVEDAMIVPSTIMSVEAAKLDALVNSRVEDHMKSSAAQSAADMMLNPTTPALVSHGQSDILAPLTSSMTSEALLNPQVTPNMLCEGSQLVQQPSVPAQEELILLSDQMQLNAVTTPPAAVKSMILNAAAEIFTSDTAMNALVTSAINTANILTTESEAQPALEPAESAMSQAVSQAVTQAMSQAVTHAVSQAVSIEMKAPVAGLTDMSDNDLLSYINTSTFDQV